jgi:hypothetical protein
MGDHNYKIQCQNMYPSRLIANLKRKGKTDKPVETVSYTNGSARVSKVLVVSSCIRNFYPLVKFT